MSAVHETSDGAAGATVAPPLADQARLVTRKRAMDVRCAAGMQRCCHADINVESDICSPTDAAFEAKLSKLLKAGSRNEAS
jgi:hypothetical protein